VIYQPIEVFDIRISLAGGLIYAAVRAAADFVSSTNKPWAYYLGSAIGGMAAATGIPNAAATLYAVGTSIDTILFKSPDGALVKVYLNGILQAQVDLNSLTSGWQSFHLDLGTGLNRIDFVNAEGMPSGEAPYWMGIGPVTVNDGYAYPQGEFVNMDTIVWRVKDVEEDSPLASFPVNVPSGKTIAQLQTYADAIGAEIDAVTGSQLMEVSVTISLAVHSGAKSSPVAGTLNERGGLITFSTSGPRADSVRIPGILSTIMPGNSFALTDTDIAALITRLTTSTTAGTIRPVTPQNYNFVTANAGKKSFRK
jgi:hypothetical protein